MTPMKFCAGCQQLRNEANGKKVVRGKATRWMCIVCLERRNETIYSVKKK